MLGSSEEAATIFSSSFYGIFFVLASPNFICDDSFQSLFYNVESIWVDYKSLWMFYAGIF